MEPDDGPRPSAGVTVVDAPPPADSPGRRIGWPVPTWWILPFTGGLLAVVAVAALVTALHHPAAKPRAAPKTRPTATAPAVPMPAMMFPDQLFRTLTQRIQAGDEAGFLALVAPAARPAVQTWWANQRALGFTTGLIMPTAAHDQVRIDSRGDGSAVVLAGMHAPLDPIDENEGNKPSVPLERYRIGLHFSAPGATGQITSWQPLGDDPWDQNAQLYVRKGEHVVVAGLPADKGLVDATLPLAETAAGYDVGLINQVNANDLHQEGFVVFVAGSRPWFSTTPQRGGWPTAFGGGRLFLLPGPGVSGDLATAPGNVSDDTTGGTRVVITPYQRDGRTPQAETLTLIREFMLGILAAHDQPLIPGTTPPSVPTWALEGFGIAAEALYLGNNNPAPASYDFGALTSELHGLPKAYRTGHLPSARQLFTGPAQQQWHDVAASVYAYIGMKYGMNQLLASAALLWTRYATPFGNVADAAKSTSSTLTFFTQATVEAGWRAWLARR
jgi:hypothetical protein